MKRLWNGLLFGVAFCQLPAVACAYWGIYDPVTNQQVSRSAGTHTCSGVADVAGAVTVNLLDTNANLEDFGSGTADSSAWHAWTADLANPSNWSVDPYYVSRHTAQLLDSNTNIKHQTYPQIVP